MKKLFVLLFLCVLLFSSDSFAMSDNVLVNIHAAGFDDRFIGKPGKGSLEGWQYTDGITYQVCCKAPGPIDYTVKNAPAFKCGPVHSQGNCVYGEPESLWQVFSVEYSPQYIVNFDVIILSQKALFVNFDLYGIDGDSEVLLGRLLTWDNNPDGYKVWPWYQGDTLIVDYYPEYKFQVDMAMLSQSGLKIVAPNLVFTPKLPDGYLPYIGK